MPTLQNAHSTRSHKVGTESSAILPARNKPEDGHRLRFLIRSLGRTPAALRLLLSKNCCCPPPCLAFLRAHMQTFLGAVLRCDSLASGLCVLTFSRDGQNLPEWLPWPVHALPQKASVIPSILSLVLDHEQVVSHLCSKVL